MDNPPTHKSMRQEADEYWKTYWAKTYEVDDFVKGAILDMMAGFALDLYVKMENAIKEQVNAESKK